MRTDVRYDVLRDSTYVGTAHTLALAIELGMSFPETECADELCIKSTLGHRFYWGDGTWYLLDTPVYDGSSSLRIEEWTSAGHVKKGE